VLANQGTCTCTDSCTNSGTHSRVTGYLSNDSAQGCATGATNQSTFRGIVATYHYDTCAKSQDHSLHFLHNFFNVLIVKHE
jgi:hypothetical protein